MSKKNCWEYNKNCRNVHGAADSRSLPCPSSTMVSLSGLNGGKNAGRICWNIAGSFSGHGIRKIALNDRPSCVRCDFFKLVEAEEGDNFKFLTPDSLHGYEQYRYGKRKSARFESHLDLELRLPGGRANYIVGVTGNISRGGLSFISENINAKTGETLQFRIQDRQREKTVPARGEIIWKQQVRDRCLAGIKITGIDDQIKTEIVHNAYEKYFGK